MASAITKFFLSFLCSITNDRLWFCPIQNPTLPPTETFPPTKSPTGAPPTFTPKATIGVYYYPWHHDATFHGGEYLRKYLDPPQLPILGEYIDRDESVLSQHLSWSRQAKISLWVCSWWGPGKKADVTMLNHILTHPELNDDMKIAIHYETAGRTSDFTDYSNIQPDITYLAENYFNHPNYYKIDGRPVIVIYRTRRLTLDEDKNLVGKIMASIRSTASESGYNIYIVGDEIFGRAPATRDSLVHFDAVTTYDVYGSMGEKGLYANEANVDYYIEEQGKWRDMAQAVGTSYIPCVTPGYNDKGVRDRNEPLSRKINNENSAPGSLFSALVTRAIDMVDTSSDELMLVTSFNEWHEDTQIEPVNFAIATNVDESSSGQFYTNGIYYEGYETLYLDILSDANS